MNVSGSKARAASSKNKIKSIFIVLGLIAFVGGLGFAYYTLTGSVTGLIFSIVLGAVYALASYFGAAKMALKVNKAQEVTKSDQPELFEMVEDLAKKAAMPMPKLYIMPDRAANAFATGRSPDKAHVAVTEGILNALNKDELKAVLAHELSHVRNYDIRLMMVVFACVTSLNLILDFLLRSFIFNDDNNGGGFMIYILLSMFTPIIGFLVQAAISRQREFAADASGAELTHKPQDLATALVKIHNQGSALKKQSSATAHLFFANPLKGGKFSKLLSTHPPVEARVAALESMKQ